MKVNEENRIYVLICIAHNCKDFHNSLPHFVKFILYSCLPPTLTPFVILVIPLSIANDRNYGVIVILGYFTQPDNPPSHNSMLIIQK